MFTKESIVALISLVLGIISAIFGKQLFSNEQTQQLGEIVFLLTTFIYAYLHKPKGSDTNA